MDNLWNEMGEARDAVMLDERRRLEDEGWDWGSAWIAVILRFEGQQCAKWVAAEVDRQRRGERPRFYE